jgi:hypothetical protein
MRRRAGVGILAFLSLAFAFLTPSASAQEKIPAPADTPTLDEIVKETQKSFTNPGHTGLVWWIPTEFWEAAAIKNGTKPERARQLFEPLRRYVVFAIAVGTIRIGNIDWYNEQIIRSSVTLRDFDGTVYAPLADLSGDAKGLVSIFKPILSNISGAMGQNMQLLFFPSKTAGGKSIADPTHESIFTIVFSYPEEKLESKYEWRLPLTSLSPPKYCPVGKERVKADWKFCPWHGNKLESSPSPSDTAPAQAHSEEKKVP